MTHDELMDAINKQIITAPPFALGGYTKFLQGLSAVVELHKPIFRGCDSPACCGEEDICRCGDEYPCDTIKVIEKELA